MEIQLLTGAALAVQSVSHVALDVESLSDESNSRTNKKKLVPNKRGPSMVYYSQCFVLHFFEVLLLSTSSASSSTSHFPLSSPMPLRVT